MGCRIELLLIPGYRSRVSFNFSLREIEVPTGINSSAKHCRFRNHEGSYAVQ